MLVLLAKVNVFSHESSISITSGPSLFLHVCHQLGAARGPRGSAVHDCVPRPSVAVICGDAARSTTFFTVPVCHASHHPSRGVLTFFLPSSGHGLVTCPAWTVNGLADEAAERSTAAGWIQGSKSDRDWSHLVAVGFGRLSDAGDVLSSASASVARKIDAHR